MPERRLSNHDPSYSTSDNIRPETLQDGDAVDLSWMPFKSTSHSSSSSKSYDIFDHTDFLCANDTDLLDFTNIIDTSNMDSSTLGPANPHPCLSPLPTLGRDKSVRAMTKYSEIFLFQHYLNSTCHKMPLSSESEMNQLWSIDVPQWALRSACLLDTLLAISSLQLRSDNMLDDELVRACEYYHRRALQSCRKDIQIVSEENKEQRVAMVFLLQLQCWLARSLCSNESSYCLPIEAMQTMLEAQSFLLRVTPSLLSGARVRNIIHSQWSLPTEDRFTFLDEIHTLVQKPRLHTRQRYQELIAILENMEEPSSFFTSQYNSDIQSTEKEYNQSIAYLVAVQSALYADDTPDAISLQIFLVSMSMPPALVEGVRLKHPLPLGILARVFALWKSVGGAWWINGISEYEVMGINELMSEQDQYLMDWPMKRIMQRSRHGI
jgi:hypothetical protein